MAKPGQRAFPVQGKRELGEVKGERQSSRKHHAGRPQTGLFEASQANLGVSLVRKDKLRSVSKAGGVLRSLVKSGHSGRRALGRQGLLLSPLHSAKGQGQTPSNHRSFLIKQRYKESKTEDARPKVNSQVDKTRDVGCEARFKRCLLPRSSPPFGLEILQVSPSQGRNPSEEFLLQKDAIRPDHGSLGVLKDPGSIIEDPKTSRDPSVRLFGRFFDPSSLQGGSFKGHGGGHQVTAGSWIQNKLGQVLCGTSQDCGIFRSSNKSGRLNIQSPRGEDPKNPSDLSNLSRDRSYLKEVSGRDGRFSYLRRKLPEMGKAPVKTSPKLDECQHFSHSEGPLGAGGRRLQESLSSLVKREFSSNSNILCGNRGLERDYDRRLGGGLVRGSPTQNPVGGLARAMETPVNELEGVKGNPFISNSFQGRSRGLEGES